jgi:hypothetical protein
VQAGLDVYAHLIDHPPHHQSHHHSHHHHPHGGMTPYRDAIAPRFSFFFAIGLRPKVFPLGNFSNSRRSLTLTPLIISYLTMIA